MSKGIVKLVMKAIDSTSKKELTLEDNGTIELEMNKAYGIMGVISVIISILLFILLVRNGFEDLDFVKVVGIMSLIFGAVGVLLVLVGKNIKVLVTDRQITYYGLMSKEKTIFWSQIEKITFNKNSLELSLITSETKIKLHMHLVGFNSFIKVLKQKVNSSIYKGVLGE